MSDADRRPHPAEPAPEVPDVPGGTASGDGGSGSRAAGPRGSGAPASGAPGEASAGTSEAVMVLEEQIVVLLGRAKALWREAAASVHPDLQPLGYRMLSTLVKHGPSRPGHLACVLETDKSVVSRQARELESLGLLEVLPDPDDGRGRLLQASPVARSNVAEMRRRALAGLAASLDALGEGEAERLADLLARVNAALAP
ncbi:DNA-binding MarR family transcriptional regulator [Salana multivorans]|uniref:DNA-binding MarR family transcriptional regulator n=1 Tax=Salana multivorans TaxID=120377 RepID=A0A3N2D9P8_9MICO|nr:MarR family winged helix-turn-helix transcriptional regulator [Salana multivorans]ROR96525.1 DNA-binding MarR family transcriptional regulator [Salana multivorans]